jgi:cbb3-type cytochrome oxidase subunit 3
MYNLPEYEPSDDVWKNIESKLNNDVLQKAIGKLNTYEPDDEIWEQIESKLLPKVVKFHVWKWASIAASIVLIAGIYFIYNPDNQSITYSEQKIDENLLLNKTDDSQQQYEMIVAYCKQQTYVCENREFKALKTELEELNTASIQLKEAVGQYNTEPELIAQLTTIEQQKSDILRKMAAKI